MSITGHVVLTFFPADGHWPTFFVFAVKLIKHRPGTVATILTVGDHHVKIERALDVYFTDEEIELRKNIHVVKTGGEGSNWEALLPVAFQTSGPYLASLASSSEIMCQTGKKYPGIIPPACIIVDLFHNGLIDVVRSTFQTPIPLYFWYSGCTSSLLRFNKNIRGFGDAANDALAVAKRENKSVEQVSYEMYYPNKGEVRDIPGCPPMYDYEWHIERPPFEIALGVVELGKGIFQLFKMADGLFGVSDEGLEPESSQVLRDWFGKINKKAYLVGPLIPKEHDTHVAEVEAFLSSMQERYGEHSVIYISFGTTFCPMGPALSKVMEVLLNMDIPLIFSFAAFQRLPPGLGLSPNIIERMKQSDRVYTSSWVPQRMILNHKATGFFMCHGGQNGFTEAIAAGVPLIVYPITVDQPLVAAIVSIKLKIGYELLEVRTGEALQPAYRGVQPTGTPEAIEKEIRNVIVNAFGPDGDEKRKNICALRDKRNACWDENGSSTQDFERFIRDHFPEAV